MVHRATDCSDKSQVCDAPSCGLSASVTCDFRKQLGLGRTQPSRKGASKVLKPGRFLLVEQLRPDQVSGCRFLSFYSLFPICCHRCSRKKVVPCSEVWPCLWGLNTGSSTEKLLSRKWSTTGGMFTPIPQPGSFGTATALGSRTWCGWSTSSPSMAGELARDPEIQAFPQT